MRVPNIIGGFFGSKSEVADAAPAQTPVQLHQPAATYFDDFFLNQIVKEMGTLVYSSLSGNQDQNIKYRAVVLIGDVIVEVDGAPRQFREGAIVVLERGKLQAYHLDAGRRSNVYMNGALMDISNEKSENGVWSGNIACVTHNKTSGIMHVMQDGKYGSFFKYPAQSAHQIVKLASDQGVTQLLNSMECVVVRGAGTFLPDRIQMLSKDTEVTDGAIIKIIRDPRTGAITDTIVLKHAVSLVDRFGQPVDAKTLPAFNLATQSIETPVGYVPLQIDVQDTREKYIVAKFEEYKRAYTTNGDYPLADWEKKSAQRLAAIAADFDAKYNSHPHAITSLFFDMQRAQEMNISSHASAVTNYVRWQERMFQNLGYSDAETATLLEAAHARAAQFATGSVEERRTLALESQYAAFSNQVLEDRQTLAGIERKPFNTQAQAQSLKAEHKGVTLAAAVDGIYDLSRHVSTQLKSALKEAEGETQSMLLELAALVAKDKGLDAQALKDIHTTTKIVADYTYIALFSGDQFDLKTPAHGDASVIESAVVGVLATSAKVLGYNLSHSRDYIEGWRTVGMFSHSLELRKSIDHAKAQLGSTVPDIRASGGGQYGVSDSKPSLDRS